MKIGKYTITKCSIMHILPIYKLVTKPKEVQNRPKRHKIPILKKNKLKNINKTSGHLTPTPKLHNVLIMETKAPKSNGISKPTANPTQIHQILAHLCHHQQHKINK